MQFPAGKCPKTYDPAIEDSHRSTKEPDGNHVTFGLLEHISYGNRAAFGHRDRGADADGAVGCKLDAKRTCAEEIRSMAGHLAGHQAGHLQLGLACGLAGNLPWHLV